MDWKYTKENIMKQMLAALGLLFTGFIGLMVMSSIINGFVLTKLWAWFVVTTFELPQLSIPTAIGISMVVRYLTYQWQPDLEGGSGDKVAKSVGFSIMFPFMTLCLGWIVHLFV